MFIESKKINLPRPEKKPFRDARIFVGIPSADGNFNGNCLVAGLRVFVELIGKADVALDVLPGALVYNARLQIIQKAIAQDSTHVLFIDDDVELDPGHPSILLDAITRTEHVAVAGIVPLRRHPPAPSVVWEDEDGWIDAREDNPKDVWPGMDELEKNPIYPCLGFGLACVIIDIARMRRALDKVYKPWAPSNEVSNPFLPMLDVEKGKVLGEDLAFCRRIREGGGTFAVATAVHPKHYWEQPLTLRDYIMERHKKGKRL